MPKGHPIPIDAERRDWLREHRPRLARRALARAWEARFGEPVAPETIAHLAYRLGVPARTSGFFPKGNRPWNAGLRGYAAGGRSAETRFKAGHRLGMVPLFTCVRQPDGAWKMKVSDHGGGGRVGGSQRDWRPIAALVYQTEVAPIPRGHVVIALDGDQEQCLDPANLACVSRAVLARLNQQGFGQLPPDRDLRRLAIAAATLSQATADAARRAGVPLRHVLPAQGHFVPGNAAAAERQRANRRRPGQPAPGAAPRRPPAAPPRGALLPPDLARIAAGYARRIGGAG